MKKNKGTYLYCCLIGTFGLAAFLGSSVLKRGGTMRISQSSPLNTNTQIEVTRDRDSNDTSPVLRISELPPELQGTPDITKSKIWTLWQEKDRSENDIQYSCWFIERELRTRGTINTNRTDLDERGRELNKHIQRCLMAFGFYNGNINGDAGVTSILLPVKEWCKVW